MTRVARRLPYRSLSGRTDRMWKNSAVGCCVGGCSFNKCSESPAQSSGESRLSATLINSVFDVNVVLAVSLCHCKPKGSSPWQQLVESSRPLEVLVFSTRPLSSPNF
ncbi:hypothetical protein AOLI_G00296560 [Acnodon oligacanthus]